MLYLFLLRIIKEKEKDPSQLVLPAVVIVAQVVPAVILAVVAAARAVPAATVVPTALVVATVVAGAAGVGVLAAADQKAPMIGAPAAVGAEAETAVVVAVAAGKVAVDPTPG